MNSTFFSRLRALAGAIGSAFHAVGVADSRRTPRDGDLEAMGIDPTAYKKIRPHR